jgi:hypothetical protein
MWYATFFLTQPVGKLIKFKGRNYYIPTKINVETSYDADILYKFLLSSSVQFTTAITSTVRRGRPPKNKIDIIQPPQTKEFRSEFDKLNTIEFQTESVDNQVDNKVDNSSKVETSESLKVEETKQEISDTKESEILEQSEKKRIKKE